MKNPPLGADFFAADGRPGRLAGPARLIDCELIGTEVSVVHLLQLEVGDVHRTGLLFRDKPIAWGDFRRPDPGPLGEETEEIIRRTLRLNHFMRFVIAG